MGNKVMQIKWQELSFVRPPPAFFEEKEYRPRVGRARSEQTEQQYFERAIRKLDFLRSNLGIDPAYGLEEITPDDIFNWLDGARSNLRCSSWNLYRACFCNLIERAIFQQDQKHNDFADEKGANEIEAALNAMGATWIKLRNLKWSDATSNLGRTAAERSKEFPKKTSSGKKKNVSPEVLFRLELYMRNSGSEWQHRSLKLCWATLYTGLRLCEWDDATIKDDGETMTLIVSATNARGCSRELKITKGEARDAVREQIQSVSTWKEHVRSGTTSSDFQKVYVSQCASALRIAQRQIFGESQGITPFSFRDQFAANLKTAGFSKEDIATTMGKTFINADGQDSTNGSARRKMSVRRELAMAAEMPADYADSVQKIFVSVAH